MSQELTSRIAELRAKVLSNTATDTELQEAIAMMRQERVSASHASAGARAKKANGGAKPKIDGASVLQKMMQGLAAVRTK
jgi:ribosomal protein L12E/L44/L45/RPP1/RPP2